MVLVLPPNITAPTQVDAVTGLHSILLESPEAWTACLPLLAPPLTFPKRREPKH